MMIMIVRRAKFASLLTLLLLAPASASALSLIGEQVDLTYNFGNSSGTLSATIGAGSEFVLDGDGGGLNNIFATIDITANTLSLTHSRDTLLGPGYPNVSDDFLSFSFPNLAPTEITNVGITANPMPTWFEGTAFTGNTIDLTQLSTTAEVDTVLKVWSVVPEPSTAVLFGLGLTGLGLGGRSRN